MSNTDHPHPHDDPSHAHPHPELPQKPDVPATAEDAGSRALEEALRSSFFIVKFIMVILVIAFFFSGCRTIEPEERGVLFRLGKPVGVGEEQLLQPGLHWAFPYPIDEIVKIPIGEIQTVTSSVGWYAMPREQELAGARPQPLPSLNPAVEGYTITGDGNIVHVRATLSYRVVDPLKYAFGFVASSNVVQDILDNAIIYASAQSSVDYAWKENAGFKERVLARVVRLTEEANLGIIIEPSDVVVRVPEFVRPAFDRVADADQEANRILDVARGEADSLLINARAEATDRINEGRSEANQIVQRAKADAKAFSDQLPQYLANPELFISRRTVEALNPILSRPQDKILLPAPGDGKDRELRLLLNREPPRRPGQTNAPAQ